MKKWLVCLTAILAVIGCSDDGDADSITIYTSVTQGTVDAVVEAFQTANPDAVVEVFRAPTGELTARIAAEQREGGLQADVLWLTDPLSIQQYDRDGILRSWSPEGVEAVPDDFQTDSFFGTRILNMVIVASTDMVDQPADWTDLSDVDGVVAIPDPGFAGSAFGALGFFALDPTYGMSFYEELAANGTVEVRSPGDVTNGVAEGQFSAGMSLDFSVRGAVDDGSPVNLVWPSSGAIAIYSPIAVVDTSQSRYEEAFVEFVLSPTAQHAIADTGWQPIRADVEWPHQGTQQTIDWNKAFDQQDDLLAQYEAIFDS